MLLDQLVHSIRNKSDQSACASFILIGPYMRHRGLLPDLILVTPPPPFKTRSHTTPLPSSDHHLNMPSVASKYSLDTASKAMCLASGLLFGLAWMLAIDTVYLFTNASLSHINMLALGVATVGFAIVYTTPRKIIRQVVGGQAPPEDSFAFEEDQSAPMKKAIFVLGGIFLLGSVVLGSAIIGLKYTSVKRSVKTYTDAQNGIAPPAPPPGVPGTPPPPPPPPEEDKKILPTDDSAELYSRIRVVSLLQPEGELMYSHFRTFLGPIDFTRLEHQPKYDINQVLLVAFPNAFCVAILLLALLIFKFGRTEKYTWVGRKCRGIINRIVHNEGMPFGDLCPGRVKQNKWSVDRPIDRSGSQ